jgi:prephenate dehydrogenase
MKTKPFRNITIIGVGLLGGSVGLAAKSANERVRVVGVGRRQASLDKALACGAIDRATLDLADGVRSADLIVLATPLGQYAHYLPLIARAMKPGALVTDVGSTKLAPVRLAEEAFGGGMPFVGSHPMAGGERQGVEFAKADLFVNAVCIVTPTRHNRPEDVRRVRAFWKSLGCTLVRMDAQKHDREVARVSHLPHLLAALLVNLQTNASLKLAGKGFMDTTRIASGDPAMWREILLFNHRAVKETIDDMGMALCRFRDFMARSDESAIEKFLTHAKTHRDELVDRRRRQAE